MRMSKFQLDLGKMLDVIVEALRSVDNCGSMQKLHVYWSIVVALCADSIPYLFDRLTFIGKR